MTVLAALLIALEMRKINDFKLRNIQEASFSKRVFELSNVVTIICVWLLNT